MRWKMMSSRGYGLALLWLALPMVSGCVPAQPGSRASGVERPGDAALLRECSPVADYLRYYERLGAMDAGELRKEVAAKKAAVERDGEKAEIYLSLARLRSGSASLGPSGKKAGKPAAASGGLAGIFAKIINDIAMMQKVVQAREAKSNDDLFVAGNKIRQLEQEVHKYKQEAATLGEQIRELQEIEKIIIKRQSPEPKVTK